MNDEQFHVKILNIIFNLSFKYTFSLN